MDDHFFDNLVEAWKTALFRIQYTGAEIHLVEVRKLLKFIANAENTNWTTDEYDKILKDLFVDQYKDPQNLREKVTKSLCQDYLHFLEKNGSEYRLTTDSDRKNESFICGTKIISLIRQGTDPQKSLANNYCLAFPERMAMLWEFSLPGESKSILSKFNHHFVFHKKVNPVVTSYLVQDAKTLGMLEDSPNGKGMRLAKLPDTALASIVARCYLQVSNHRIDVGVPINDVKDALQYFISQDYLREFWKPRFSPANMVVFQLENYDSQLRFLPEGFKFMTGCGLINPVDIAKTLRNHNKKGHAQEIGKTLEFRIKNAAENASEPLNLNDFLKNFN